MQIKYGILSVMILIILNIFVIVSAQTENSENEVIEILEETTENSEVIIEQEMVLTNKPVQTVEFIPQIEDTEVQIQDQLSLQSQEITELEYEEITIPISTIMIVKEYCDMYGLDLDIMISMFYNESRFVPDIINSKSKCVGLGQINTRVHKDRIVSLGVDNILDIEGNIHVSCNYMAELISIENGNYEKALIHYNLSPSFTKAILRTAEDNREVVDTVR